VILAAFIAAVFARFAGLTALAGVPVYAGSPVTSAADMRFVVIGDDGDPESDVSAGYEQEPADLAGTFRYERGSLPCAVIAQSGDTDVQARLTEAAALLDACSDSVRADPQFAGLVLGCQFTVGTVKPVQNTAGSAVVAPFTLAYLASV
jgi:hypothetical protein